MQERGIVFQEGILALKGMVPVVSHGRLLIMDDLMNEGSGDKGVLDLFTKYSHHQNVTVIYLCQDMLPTGRYAKSISHNAHYVVAFKNPRDQLGGGGGGGATCCKNRFPRLGRTPWRCLAKRHSGLSGIDLHPVSFDDMCLLSHLLKDEGWTRCYQKAPRS